MDRSQQTSIFVLISTIESQLQAIKSLMLADGGPSAGKSARVSLGRDEHDQYTSKEEDDEIGMMLKIDEKRDQMLQTLFEQAGNENDVNGP